MRAFRILLFALIALTVGGAAQAANFVVYAQDKTFGQQVADRAEQCRRDLAIEWLGRELPNWNRPCPIRVEFANGNGGVTRFEFAPTGGVVDIDMKVQGSRQELLASIVPHEVLHTVFATYFGCALPRWADEGSCVTVEHSSERIRFQRSLVAYLKTGRGIAFDRMFAMQNYPRDILPLYAQGHSLCTFLQQHGEDLSASRKHFVSFVGAGLRNRDWSRAVESHYGYNSLDELQDTWLDWVSSGSPLSNRSASLRVDQESFALGCNLRWDPLRRLWIRRNGPGQVASGQAGQTGQAQPALPQQPLTQQQPPTSPPVEPLPPGPTHQATIDLSEYATKTELGQLRQELLGKLPAVQPIVDRVTQLEQDQTTLIDRTRLGQEIAKVKTDLKGDLLGKFPTLQSAIDQAKADLKGDLLGDHPTLASVIDTAKQDVLQQTDGKLSGVVGNLKSTVDQAAESKALNVVNTLVVDKLAGLAGAGASAGGLGALGTLGAVGGPLGIGLVLGLGLLGRAIKSGLGGAASKQPFPGK